MRLEKQFRALARRARLSVARGILNLVNDGTGIQLGQVSLMANEVRSNMERFQEYGLTSNPLPGAEAAVIFVGGERGHGLIIAVDDRRYRLTGLQNGEVALYTDEGDSIILKRGRNVEINTITLTINAQEEIIADTPVFRCTGDIIDRSDTNPHTLDGMRDIYNIHVHPENDSGGPTDPPTTPM